MLRRTMLFAAALALGCGSSHAPVSDDAGPGSSMDAGPAGDTDGGGTTPGTDGDVPGADAGEPATDAGDPTMSGGVGMPCTSNADCDGRFCSTGSSGVGYCTWVCSRDIPCPDGAVCLLTEDTFGYCLLGCDPADPRCPMGTFCYGDFGVPEPVCASGCTDDSGCPMGTVCGDRTMGFGRCLTPGASNGAACARNEECPESSFCADEASWGFAGGICIRWGCNVATNAGCLPSTTCVMLGAENTVCLPDCTRASDCRAGYACVPAPTGGGNVCLPRCTADSECTDGRRCDFLTSRCVDW